MDDAAVSATQAAFDSANFWSGWATIIVAVGVLIEFIVLFIFSKAMDWREKACLAIASGLIVVGVVGEWWYGGKAVTASEALQADASEKAANATRDAGIANERAAALEKQAAELRNKNLALESEVLTLRAAATWREFSGSQHDSLVSLIKNLGNAPKSKVLFDSVVGNPEAKHFGDLLAKALSDALEMPIDEPPGLSTCVQCTGVWVCVDADATEAASADGQIVRAALERAGVADAKFCTDPKNGQGGPTIVKVLVGPKG
jgi:hypothetical protein